MASARIPTAKKKASKKKKPKDRQRRRNTAKTQPTPRSPPLSAKDSLEGDGLLVSRQRSLRSKAATLPKRKRVPALSLSDTDNQPLSRDLVVVVSPGNTHASRNARSAAVRKQNANPRNGGVLLLNGWMREQPVPAAFTPTSQEIREKQRAKRPNSAARVDSDADAPDVDSVWEDVLQHRSLSEREQRLIDKLSRSSPHRGFLDDDSSGLEYDPVLARRSVTPSKQRATSKSPAYAFLPSNK